MEDGADSTGGAALVGELRGLGDGAMTLARITGPGSCTCWVNTVSVAGCAGKGERGNITKWRRTCQLVGHVHALN